MKILVFGASGMAGHIITLYFREQGYDVTGFSRRPITYCKNILGDATNPTDVKEALEKDDFDIVINAIGILNLFAEENPCSRKAPFIDTLVDNPRLGLCTTGTKSM